jgi:ABC-2 type transport system permease protein
MLGLSDGHPSAGLAIVVALCAVSLGGSYAMLKTGYKLRG